MTFTSMGSRSLLAIDPGLNSMGWAFWDRTRVAAMQHHVVRTPTKAGLIKAPRKLELAPRALWIANTLHRELIDLGEIDGRHTRHVDIVSEFPSWMNISLGWAAGDLQKLCFLVGVLAGYFKSAHSFTPITPGEWKGQLPKAVVTRRIQRLLGPGATREWEKDMWDAVGIGYWRLGKLFQ